jgi:hypothetical protein
MKIGLVGYQGAGKSAVFQLLTGNAPDPSKAHTGQQGAAIIPDERFDRLVEFYLPKKTVPARIELLDTPGLDRKQQSNNAQRLGVIREASAMVHVVGAFAGAEPPADAAAFYDDLILADLQIVSNRVDKLKKDSTKPRPDRDKLLTELEALEPVEAKLQSGESLKDFDFSEAQEDAVRSFSLLTRKPQLIVINTADAQIDSGAIEQLEERGPRVVAAPFGLELELESLPDEERAEFAAEMGITEPSRELLLSAIFEVTEQITFYTCDEKEVHAWLLHQGETALDAAGTIHTDLARGFIRAEITPVGELLKFASERDAKAAGLMHVEGKDYLMQDGDEIVVRFSV